VITRKDIEQVLQTKNVDEFKDFWKVEYLPFEEARNFVRKLGLKNSKEWFNYCKSEKKPLNIPADPREVFKNKGWINYFDWLGAGTNTKFISFKKAQKYVRKLGLKSQIDWFKYSKSDKKPFYIPVTPDKVYKNKGWTNWANWVGEKEIINFKSFKEAQKYVRKLGLKSSSEWRKYAKNKKPSDIPADPQKVYRNKGWISWFDFLGGGTNIKFRTFEKARTFVRSLKLKNIIEWNKYRTSGKKPSDIPSNPNTVYKNKGWINSRDFLGAGRNLSFLPFEKARTYVRKLGLKNWIKYCKSGKKPFNIRNHPQRYNGWINMKDWLGFGRNFNFRPFDKARSYVRKLKLNSSIEWKKYCKNNKKPIDIPTNPARSYKNKGWVNWYDWLGAPKIRPKVSNFRIFKNAKNYVRKLGLKSGSEWRKYAKNKKPSDIPADPQKVYRNKGWISWFDFLGGGRNLNFLPFKEARTYVRNLKLKSITDWNNYCRSKKRLSNIPTHPQSTYKNKGWINTRNWLGAGRVLNLTKDGHQIKKETV